MARLLEPTISSPIEEAWATRTRWPHARALMKFSNVFHIPLPPSAAWPLLNDVPRIAPCLPGAELLETREDGAHQGRVKLRLGPIALSFKGWVSYEDRDDQAFRARLKAVGNEERARGNARAMVDIVLTEADEGSKVSVDTDLTLAGTIAQYARGGAIVETTAQVMIDDFASNLEAMLTSETGTAPSAPSSPLEATRPSAGADADTQKVRLRQTEISVLTLLWRTFVRLLPWSKAKKP